MRAVSLLSSLLLSAGAVQAAFDTEFLKNRRRGNLESRSKTYERLILPKRDVHTSPFNNVNTTSGSFRASARMGHSLTSFLEFAVNGSAIPEVNFDAGESYAGQLPIGGDSDGNLYFWFWPTTTPDQPKEILIWLNGGVSGPSHLCGSPDILLTPW